jgi:integrase
VADIDWDNRELIVRGSRSKNHRERRLPIDAGQWEIVCLLRDGRDARQPGTGRTPERTAQLQARFSCNQVFVSMVNTPLESRGNLDGKFLRYCDRARVQTQTTDAEGRVIEHVDLHSLRRTFATNLITGGADQETVGQLMGHSTLEMTMKIYTKSCNQTQRQELAKPSYGKGTVAPDHAVQYPGMDGLSVPDGYGMVTTAEARTAQ